MRIALCFLLGLAGAASAQPAVRSSIPVETVAPRPEDVGSIDGIVKAYYEVISGPPGRPREWSRDRSLYIPGVRFVAMSVKDGKIVREVSSHQEYVDRSDEELVKNGFYETEIGRETRRYGNLAHVFSAYDMRRSKDGPLLGRGVNSLELFWDGTRWWIAAAVWDGERKENPIPKALLPRK